MSREMILGLAGGVVDERSPNFKAFLRRLGENVGKYKPEWMKVLSGSPIIDHGSDSDDCEDKEMGDGDEYPQEPPVAVEPRGWMSKAVLVMLGQMCLPGPQDGLPAVQAVCRAMLSKERDGTSLGTDEDWTLYFLKVFHREQKKYLNEVLGEAGSGELRRRLLIALRQSRAINRDDMHFGLATATKMGIDVSMVVESIGTRLAGGNSRNHEGAMPTVGQMREIIVEILDLFPKNAPSFPNWMAIAIRVFDVGLNHPPSTSTPPDEDDRNKGLVSGDDMIGPGGHGKWQASHADISVARSFIEDEISKLDQSPFPDGVHGRTFVEFLLFADRSGVIRVTQEEYAIRTGVSDGTVAYRRDAIFKALRDQGLSDFDTSTICDAFKQLQEAYLDWHLKIFGA